MLGVTPARGTNLGHATRPRRFRAQRHAADELGLGALLAAAWHPRTQALSGVCDNASLHGIGMRLLGGADKAGLLQVGDRLTGLHVTLGTGEVAFHGEGDIRHVRTDGPDLFLGVALLHGVLDLPLLLERQTRSRFSSRCEEAERLADSAQILPVFKAQVAELRSYLEVMQAFLDREEALLYLEDLYTRERACSQYLQEVGPRIVARVHAFSHGLRDVVGHLPDDGHAAHRAYAQHHLMPLFGQSPLMRRALQKPLGYAGDYEMMNMLYRPPEEGGTLFGKIMNLCAVRESAAQANINRVGFLTERLRAVVSARRDRPALLASVGCGPARELETLLTEEPALGDRLDAMLIDQDPRSIAFCEHKLTGVARRTGAQIHFVRESVRRLLTGGSLAATLGPRDLIYSAGLFDYLSERSFATLTAALYDALAPGGTLIIGNVDQSNPTRYFMEYFLEWFLVHRTRAQLEQQARLLRPVPRNVRVESEQLGVNLFLIVEK